MILTHGANSLLHERVTYHTDFSAFDVQNKTDYPEIGQTTSYNNSGKIYAIGSDGQLVVDTDSSNTEATNGITFDVDKNTELKANVQIDYWHTSGTLHFLWLKGFGYDYEPSYGNQVNIMVKDTLSYELRNGATFIENDVGFNWVSIPNSSPGAYNDFSVNFKRNGNTCDAEVLFNGVVYVVVSDVPTSQEFFIDPRKKGTIGCKYVTITAGKNY